MELVEQHRGNAGQGGVPLEAADEHTLRYDFDARAGGDGGLESDSVADGGPGGLLGGHGGGLISG